jgi:hypothetical protein
VRRSSFRARLKLIRFDMILFSIARLHGRC